MKHLLTLVLLALFSTQAFGQARPGSIYNPNRGPQSMIADKTARRPGDLLTVLITESQEVANQEQSALTRETSLEYALTSFNVKPSAFSVLPDVGGDSSDEFTGSANYQKSGSFQARITAIVMDVLPNGNMVLSGRREIRIDKEIKTIEFSGIVRRYDVQPNNTIESELVAEARVSYVGNGPLTQTTNRRGLGGVLHDAMSWLWPF